MLPASFRESRVRSLLTDSKASGTGSFRRIMWACLLVVSTGAIAGTRKAEGQVAGGQRQEVPANTAQVVIRDTRTVASEVPGLIEFMIADSEGSPINAGEEIIRLRADVLKQELASAKLKAESEYEVEFQQKALEKANVDEQRLLQGNEESVRAGVEPPYNESELLSARLEVQKAEAQLKKAKHDKKVLEQDVKTKEAQLEQYRTLAPMTGFITKVHFHQGENITQGEPILELANLSTVRVVAKVSAAVRHKILVGDPIVVRLNGVVSNAIDPSAASTFTGGPQSRESSGGSGGLGQGLFEDQCSPAEPTAATPAAPREFMGRVTYISPIIAERQGQLFEVYADVPNEVDNKGRYILQEGVNIDASILAEQ